MGLMVIIVAIIAGAIALSWVTEWLEREERELRRKDESEHPSPLVHELDEEKSGHAPA